MSSRSSILVLAISSALALAPTPAAAQGGGTLDGDALACQRAIGKAGQKFKKAKLKAWQKCLDGLLTGKGCDTGARDSAIATAEARFVVGVQKRCTSPILFTAAPAGVGFPQSCYLGSGPIDADEAECQTRVVNDPASLTRCLICWKQAELHELLKLLYPCQAGELPAGSDLDCGTAPASCPADASTVSCLRTIAKAGASFLLAREKAMEKCVEAVRKGKIAGPCPDGSAQKKITAAEAKRAASIQKCTALPSWWDVCPASCGLPIATLGDVTECVGDAGEAGADELVCQQYPRADLDGVSCPPPALPTTTTTSTTTTTTTVTTTTTTTSTTMTTTTIPPSTTTTTTSTSTTVPTTTTTTVTTTTTAPSTTTTTAPSTTTTTTGGGSTSTTETTTSTTTTTIVTTTTVVTTTTLTTTTTTTTTTVPTTTIATTTTTSSSTTTTIVRTCTFRSGTQALIQSKGLIGAVTVGLTGHQDWHFGPTEAGGLRAITIPPSGTHFDPATLPFGAGTLCARANPALVGTGVIDCDGGQALYGNTVQQDHNSNSSPDPFGADPTCTATFVEPDGTIASAHVEDAGDVHPGVCNSPVHIVENGSFAAGGMKLTEHLILRIISSGSCPPDGTPFDDAAGDLLVTGSTTTGLSAGTIFNVNNTGSNLAQSGSGCGFLGGSSCTCNVSGTAFGCSNIDAGNLTLGKLGAAFPALDIPTLNDVVASLSVLCQ